MERYFSNVAIVTILLLSLSACQPGTSKTSVGNKSQITQSLRSNVEPFEIGGIGFGTSTQDVKQKMGNPLKVEREHISCENNIVCENWEYEATWFYFYGGEVEGMGTTSPSMCLFDDVCPNQPIEDVFEYMGEEKIWPASSDKPPLVQYLSKTHESCWLWVFLNLEQDTVQELRLACQP